MRNFSNVAEKDCIRLIIAQELKELGIDVEHSGNMTHDCNNLTAHHRLQLSANANIINLSQSAHLHNQSLHTKTRNNCSCHLTFHASKTSHNKSNISANLLGDNQTNSQAHDSQLAPSGKLFGTNLKRLETSPVSVNDQLLAVPR